MALPMVFHAQSATIRDGIQALQAGGANIALATDDDGVLVGVVTDGDIRRAWLAGHALSDPVAPLLQTAPLTVTPGESRTSVLELMQARGISQVPIVDGLGVLHGVHLVRELLGQNPRPNVALVLAGGRGTRLQPVTNSIPKPMVDVAGRPILERIVTHLVGFGINRIILATGYMGEVIEAHFGDGTQFGCSIDYLRENPERPLGTGGPLAFLSDVEPGIAAPVLVLNGDLVTQFDVGSLLQHHDLSGAVATIGVVAYAHEVPFGVLTTSASGAVMAITEKPLRLEIVSAGIYALQPSVLASIPRGEYQPITRILSQCIERGQRVLTWDCEQDWIDVGRPQDLARARGEG